MNLYLNTLIYHLHDRISLYKQVLIIHPHYDNLKKYIKEKTEVLEHLEKLRVKNETS